MTSYRDFFTSGCTITATKLTYFFKRLLISHNKQQFGTKRKNPRYHLITIDIEKRSGMQVKKVKQICIHTKTEKYTSKSTEWYCKTKKEKYTSNQNLVNGIARQWAWQTQFFFFFKCSRGTIGLLTSRN